MGYTLYWYRKPKIHSKKIWNNFIKDCKTLYENMPKEHNGDVLLLNGSHKYEKATFNEEEICFNGCQSLNRRLGKEWQDKDTDKDLGHESFHLNRKIILSKYNVRENKEDMFSFCKTARKPYDLMVTACLILYKYYFKKDVKISGDDREDGFLPAVKFISKVIPERGKVIALDFHTGGYIGKD